jgi:sugar O-acyltransferase (sialic acid O-acetyltransferase NeuD family)
MSRSALTQYPDAMVVSLIGSEKTFSHREKIIGNFDIKLARFATVIHPKSNVSSYASLGYDVIVHAGVTIPSNAKIGNHTFILPNTVIHHDVVVEDYCVIGANVVIAGGVIIEKNCYLGSSSSIKNDLRIGSGSLVGMAANVLKSCDENAILIGNPARAVNTKK